MFGAPAWPSAALMLGNSFPVASLLAPQPEQVGDVVEGTGASKPYNAYRLADLGSRDKRRLEDAKKYIMDQNIKAVLKKQSINVQQQQANSMKRTQALMLLSRIYVGSISYEITEDLIRNTFSPFGPIKSVSLSYDPLTQKHKGFCFLEYELPEAAQLALEQMNNVPMGGRTLKVGRPSNIPQVQHIIDEIIGEAKMYNRIYVAGVHPDLSEDDLRMVFEAFGTITYCKLQPDATWSGRKHRGFGYLEYATSQSAADAVNSMNLFDLGGRLLRVGRALTSPGTFVAHPAALGIPDKADSPARVTPALPTAAAVAAAEITAQIIGRQAQNFSVTNTGVFNHTGDGYSSSVSSQASNSPAQMLSLSRPQVPPPAVVIPKLGSRSKSASNDESSRDQKGPTTPIDYTGAGRSSWDDDDSNDAAPPRRRPNDTRVVLLQNMVSLEECDGELEGEIEEECSKYGPVSRVRLHIVGDGVKIFVLFKNSQGARGALTGLNGRFFAGKRIEAREYDEEKFLMGDLDH